MKTINETKRHLSDLEKHMIIKEYESSPKPTQSIKDMFPKPRAATKTRKAT